jgi:alcohol dehydrogenase class IV
MAIVQNINNVYQFREAFRLAGRMDQFSYEGLEVLFDYLDELSEDIGEPIELDPVALCCEYYESSIEEIIDQYNLDVSYAEGDEDEIKEMVREYLEYKTSVCGEVSDGFVYAAF